MWHSLDVALPHSVRGRFAKSTPVDTMGKKPSRSRASAAAPLLQAVKAEAETSDDGFRQGSTRRKSGGETSATESKSKKSKNVKKSKKEVVASSSDGEAAAATVATLSADSEEGSESLGEDGCMECGKVVKKDDEKYKTTKMHKACGKRRAALERALTVGKHTKSKKKLKALKKLRSQRPSQYRKTISKIKLSKKGSRITSDQIALLKVGLDKAVRAKAVQEKNGFVFLTKLEFPSYARTRWRMKEKAAIKYYEELKNEKGALIGQNKRGKSTLGIEKPMELDNTDTLTMQREKKAKAGKMKAEDANALAAGFGSSITGSRGQVKQALNGTKEDSSDAIDSTSDSGSGSGSDSCSGSGSKSNSDSDSGSGAGSDSGSDDSDVSDDNKKDIKLAKARSKSDPPPPPRHTPCKLLVFVLYIYICIYVYIYIYVYMCIYIYIYIYTPYIYASLSLSLYIYIYVYMII